MTTAPDPVRAASFRSRFRARQKLVGTFIKTPSIHATEILGGLGFDFVVIDEEHAPFNRETTDQILLAARAARIAGIVRVADISQALSVLDCGAEGILIPHVDSAERARKAVAACRYRGGSRGFSNSSRAGGYGALGIAAHVTENDERVTVIAMIEDPSAIEVIDEILAVEGLDGIFIGRGDLTVAYGETTMSCEATTAATAKVLAAARRAGKPAAIMTAGAEESAGHMRNGASCFITASDQGFLRQAASAVLAAYGALPAALEPETSNV
ncbi:aldolase/citrate lyase family protein [Frigidibacter sp. MR17.14]|uniref:HpcH/HpaI aldolase family protein n=1 Tax=Frigidibacter sp. MR17.14 TaxID=3126509 RepID=UPI003012A65B